MPYTAVQIITPVIKKRYMFSKHLGGFPRAGLLFMLRFSSRSNSCVPSYS